ncbi:uncharacterized protein [Arachis hypogaea]|uniref:uncharacterized protein n=1 Tax=Arachis hypogaea TaxID=3818 RepID=UPI000DEDB876|nr:uncharacterized protein LOC112778324 [Arachis hypogaea]
MFIAGNMQLDARGVSVLPSDKISDIGEASREIWMTKQKAIGRRYTMIERSHTIRFLGCCKHYRVVVPEQYVSSKPYRTMMDTLWCASVAYLMYSGPSLPAEVFKHCKPFVSVDSTHLYGKYSGVLLIAVIQDGNNNILPIAFAIVESDSTKSWSFFFTNLRRHVTQ